MTGYVLGSALFRLRWGLWALSLASLASGMLGMPDSTRAADPKPNILFIYTDDHSYRTIGCYDEAYPWVRTPNIDRLAQQGVRFQHAVIGTWCMPSRATMLTGHLQHGVQSMRMEGEYPKSVYDPAQCPFWPSVFRKNGYQTAHIGKWHTGVDSGFGRDWDYQVVWNRPKHVDNAGQYYDNQLLETNGGPPVLTKGYTTDHYTQLALDYLDGKNRDPNKPWYLWLCYGAVHGPFTPAERHQQAYPDAKVPTPVDIFPPKAGKPDYVNKLDFWVRGDDGLPYMKGKGFASATVEGRGLHGNSLEAWVRQYHQGVLALDEAVGKLLAGLEKTGQAKNTLVVFTSDQGFGWGQHGFRSKLAPYDATIRSPLIFSMPGRLPQGVVCNTPVSGADLPPTFFGMAGLPLPWSMHGHDLAPLLADPKATWPHPCLMTFTARKYGKDTATIPTDPKERDLEGVPWWISLRQGSYKYIRTLVEGEIEELYDIDSDPDELQNLALSPEFSATLSRYRASALSELRRTGAPMVDHLPKTRTER